jgi:hypothetical protein
VHRGKLYTRQNERLTDPVVQFHCDSAPLALFGSRQLRNQGLQAHLILLKLLLPLLAFGNVSHNSGYADYISFFLEERKRNVRWENVAAFISQRLFDMMGLFSLCYGACDIIAKGEKIFLARI